MARRAVKGDGAESALGQAALEFQASERAAFASFVEAFSRRISFDDTGLYAPDALVRVCADLWALGRDRKAGTSAVAVRPLPGEGGESGATSVQIVTDDMHFIVDSVLGEITESGLSIRRVLHTIVDVTRGRAGRRTACAPADTTTPVKRDAVRESVIHVELPPLAGEQVYGELEAALAGVLGEVRVVVADWQAMAGRLDDCIRDLPKSVSAEAREDLPEIVEFLKWLRDDNFTLLGVRDYQVRGETEIEDLEPVDGSGLGILRDPSVRVLRRGKELVVMTPEVRAFLKEPAPIILTKANVRSRVHRRVHMDYLGVKIFTKKGTLAGERRFIGLFTSAAYTRATREIPLLRRKVARAVAAAGFPANGYDEHAFRNIAETFPRDELFQISDEEFLATGLGILKLSKRPHTKLFVRYDKFDRFVSVLLFVPRERYDSDLSRRVEDLLCASFDGQIAAVYPQFGDTPLARVHYIVRHLDGPTPRPDLALLERRIEAMTRNWRDMLEEALNASGLGIGLMSVFGQAFSAAYREAFTPEEAIEDIRMIEPLVMHGEGPTVAIRTYRHKDDDPSVVRVKLYHRDTAMVLSDALPVFENMGLTVLGEAPYPVTAAVDVGQARRHPVTVFVHELDMHTTSGAAVDATAVRAVFEAGFLAVWRGEAENDAFNRLILLAGLAPHDVTLLRALARYLRQTGIAFSFNYIGSGLGNHPKIARLIVDYFYARFEPRDGETDETRAERETAAVKRIEEALEGVSALDEDRIVRRMTNVVQSALRTNFFQRDAGGERKPYLSIKIRSREVDELPLPRPYAEIWVYSPRVEGVHLRFGKVARGGLRWSDRREDFRTEVLGLVKAQQVKNAVIVPVGAKGGFFPKQLPEGGTREEIQAEAIASYKTFISGLLDLTDNYVPSGIEHPRAVMRHDEDDPYLVVAADKGTATFSDIANSVAISYGFWLGDAFASGGSAGYDHKKMGITARGAWEAVKRHFRETGRDIQTAPFTAVGVGDMSGDVFGNGMLLSRETRLVAAFDHRDIFIDPDPDPKASFEERRRLFALARSSWADYNTTHISKGGGVFSRKLKSIPLSPEIRAALGIEAERLAPSELMRAILKAPVDLLWFGGIGTYVKARHEAHADVGDRANDAVRINAHEIRAKVVGEGANLGVTQDGRIAYARLGGRINTDAIDNSAGVDSSDHEVNLKILLNAAVAEGRLGEEARNALLASMTDDVAALVLKNNYEQTLALSLAEATASQDLDAHGRFMRLLERDGRLDRAVEHLPDEEGLRELADLGEGLTRPELAVLLAYAKTWVFDHILASDVPDEEVLKRDLVAYFPPRLAEPYGADIARHRLRREIVATEIANDLVNMGGMTFVNRASETASVSVPTIARGYVAAREAFALAALHREINQLDIQISAEAQTELHLEVRNFLRRQTLWFVRHAPDGLDLGRTIAQYRPGLAELARTIDAHVAGTDGERLHRRYAAFIEAGVPDATARAVVNLRPLASACDIVDLAQGQGLGLEPTTQVYFALGAVLGLDRLRAATEGLKGAEHWERLANRRILEELYRLQRGLAGAAISQGLAAGGAELGAEGMIAQWAKVHEANLKRTIALVTEMEASGAMSTAKLTLAVTQYRDLLQGQAAPARAAAG
ncbi:MAG: NAD-glutamate dehydrogenase [Alphaproteobacteria bacterium]|nr:NAD-glutamate dehydrogenase [Alphaproteobacteria bacterium]